MSIVYSIILIMWILLALYLSLYGLYLVFPENKIVKNILFTFVDMFLYFDKDQKEIRARKKESKRRMDIFQNGTSDERVELLNSDQKGKANHNLYLTDAEIYEKYNGIDFENTKVFIVDAPHSQFSLEKEKIIEHVDMEFDEKTQTIKNKDLVSIIVYTWEHNLAEKHFSELEYDYLFIFRQDKTENRFRYKVLDKPVYDEANSSVTK